MVFPAVKYRCESWAIKNTECQRTDVFELWCSRRLLSPLDYKEIEPVSPKGNHSWIFVVKTDAEAETPILWPPDSKNFLEKTLMLGRLKVEEKGTTEDMVRWHHQLDGVDEFEPAPGIGDGQGSVACYSPWGHKVLDATERLNWTDLVIMIKWNKKWWTLPGSNKELSMCAR